MEASCLSFIYMFCYVCFHCLLVFNMCPVTHLECVRLGEVGHPSHLHGEPHVHHLCGDVAERQVADHHLLHLSGGCKANVTDGGQRSPRDLRVRQGENTLIQCSVM